MPRADAPFSPLLQSSVADGDPRTRFKSAYRQEDPWPWLQIELRDRGCGETTGKVK